MEATAGTIIPNKPKRMSWAKGVTALAGGLATLALAFFGYTGKFTGNVRTVIPGRAYRSAQLSPQQLDEEVRKNGIRTVISLRGGSDQDSWYEKESEICTKDGAAHEAISLRASALPRPKDLKRLLEVFDTAQYPIMWHCQGGADRSGLAAVIFLHSYAGWPLDKAEAEGLTWRYGHLRMTAGSMDEFFELYRKEGAGTDLRTWILDKYPDVWQEARRRKKHRSDS